MASQLGTISFVSAPAFLALTPVAEGGGPGWIAYEFGVPLALIFIMAVLIPVYLRAGVISIYEYLRQRFNPATQIYVALLFQLSRGLATGVAVYTIGFVVASFFGEVEPARVWPYVVARQPTPVNQRIGFQMLDGAFRGVPHLEASPALDWKENRYDWGVLNTLRPQPSNPPSR